MIGTRFFTGMRVYNAVLGEVLDRGRALRVDPAWAAACGLPGLRLLGGQMLAHRRPRTAQWGVAAQDR